MRTDSEICVVYITDENYAMPTYISIMSLQENGGNEQYKVYILGDDVSEESRKRFEGLNTANFKIICLAVRNEEYLRLAETCLTVGTHVSKTALFKFNLPEILPEDKVLYLDCDIIVNKSINELFRTDISEKYIAAVDDMGDEIRDGQSHLASKIGMSGEHYFNSGVMLLNLKLMREENITQALLRYRKKEANYFMDQDALNFVLSAKRSFLDRKYNFSSTVVNMYLLEDICDKFCEKQYSDVDSCIRDQVIIHLTDKLKPWVYNIPWFTDLFLKYYNKSVYKEDALTLKSMSYFYVTRYLHLLEEFDKCYNRVKSLQQKLSTKQWKFPYDKLERGSKIVLYGAGAVGKDLYQQAEYSQYCATVLWVDQNYDALGEPIKNPKEILHYDYDYILIASTREDVINEVMEKLESMGVEKRKILII